MTMIIQARVIHVGFNVFDFSARSAKIEYSKIQRLVRRNENSYAYQQIGDRG